MYTREFQFYISTIITEHDRKPRPFGMKFQFYISTIITLYAAEQYGDYDISILHKYDYNRWGAAVWVLLRVEFQFYISTIITSIEPEEEKE